MSEIKRKLASVKRIKNIQPVSLFDKSDVQTGYADNILSAIVTDSQNNIEWHVVVMKEYNFKENDLVLFFEIDSWLPKRPEFQFLEKENYRVQLKKFSKKFGNIVSQGIVLPLSICYDMLREKKVPEFAFNKVLIEGKDMTSLLDIVKWDDYDYTIGKTLGDFPKFIPKTDQVRIQNEMKMIDLMHGKPYQISIKVDGSSSTYFYNEKLDHFGVCSRKQEKKQSNNCRFWSAAVKYDLETILRKNPGIAIQGEVCGPGIQKNRMGLREIELYVYDIWDFINKRYYNFDELKSFCDANKLTMVQVIESGDEYDYDLESLEKIVKLYTYSNGHIIEGIVVKLQREEIFHVEGERSSFKFMYDEYLHRG
jgi:RNA ligase (TIGR02306 family)